MLLNDLDSNVNKLKRINNWMQAEYGFTVDTASKDDLVEMKKDLEGLKQQIREGSESHQDPRYMRHILMSEAIDIMMGMTQPDPIVVQQEEEIITENEEIENAEILLAAQNMVDKLAGMAEDVAEMQTSGLMPLVDQIKYNISADAAANFNNTVKAALQTALDTIASTKDALSDQVAVISGNEPAGDMMADPEAPAEEPLELPAEEPAADEAPLDLGDEEAGDEGSPLGREEK